MPVQFSLADAARLLIDQWESIPAFKQVAIEARQKANDAAKADPPLPEEIVRAYQVIAAVTEEDVIAAENAYENARAEFMRDTSPGPIPDKYLPGGGSQT